MTTLITGGTGLIGSAIAETLAARDEPVVCFDIAGGELPDGDVTVTTGDIVDRDALAECVEGHGVERIAHTAAIIGRTETHRDPTRALQVNGVGTDNVFSIAEEYDLDRVVWASTLGVYGPASHYPADSVSETAVAPAAYNSFEGASFYRALKQLNEYQSRLYSADKGVPTHGIRPSVVFGPKRERMWLGRFIDDALHEGESTIERPPDSELSLVYMTDVADLFVHLLLAETPRHHVYNTGGNPIRVRELADIVERETGGTVHCDEDAPPKPSPTVIEYERAVEEFGYSITPIDEAVRDYVARVS